MIKKSLAVVTLAFMIIFVGSQSKVAEAKAIYIGYMGDFINGYENMNGDGYLLSDSVRGNSNVIICNLIIRSDANGEYPAEYTFKKGLKSWSSVSKNFGVIRASNCDLTDFDKKLLNYILNNYE